MESKKIQKLTEEIAENEKIISYCEEVANNLFELVKETIEKEVDNDSDIEVLSNIIDEIITRNINLSFLKNMLDYAESFSNDDI